jgi:hypothetical protein
MPDAYARLVDDAAVFPPGNLSLDDAVSAHRDHRASPYAGLVGPLVVPDTALPDLIGRLEADEPLAVSVVVTGGAGAVEPAARWAGDAGQVELAALELGLRDEEDLSRNARRVTKVIDQLFAAGHLRDETLVYVEVPSPSGPAPTTGWLDALDELAGLELGLKFRTGGDSRDRFPTPAQLAACIDAALDRELPFKCTAGLHHAVRHPDTETGIEHHGFLNVLLATRAALDGVAVEEIAAVLGTANSATVLSQLAEAGDPGLTSSRRWFRSFGSCSVRDPLADLVGLGLLAQM